MVYCHRTSRWGEEKEGKGDGEGARSAPAGTHPAAPWSRSAAGLPRGIALRRVPAPDGWAPWAALLALVLIKQIKQRHSVPGPRGCAAPGNPGRLRGTPLPLLPQPGRLKSGQREAGGGCCGSLTAGIVSRALCRTQGTGWWQPPARGQPRLHPAFRSVSPSLRTNPSEGAAGSWRGGPGEERRGERPVGQTGREAGDGFWEEGSLRGAQPRPDADAGMRSALPGKRREPAPCSRAGSSSSRAGCRRPPTPVTPPEGCSTGGPAHPCPQRDPSIPTPFGEPLRAPLELK